MNPEPNSERRASTAEFHQIATCYHQLDTRVAVLETRIDAQEHRLGTIEADVRIIRTNVAEVLERLTAHVISETQMQRKILAWLIATLLSTLGAAASVIAKYYLVGH